MNVSRQAINLFVLSSTALLIWLVAKLQMVEQTQADVEITFQQTLNVLVLIQSFVIAVIFFDRDNQTWQSDALAVLHVLFFPLPFYVLIWLTGSASVMDLLKTIAVVCVFAAAVLLVRQLCRGVEVSQTMLSIVTKTVYFALALLMWAALPAYRNWLNL